MTDINASLLETLNGPAPQQKTKGLNKFEFVEGSDNAQHNKLVDLNGEPFDIKQSLENLNQSVKANKPPQTQNVKDVDVKTELALIKQQNIDLNNKLDSVIKEGRLQSDTQLTGSNVAVPVDLQYHELSEPIPVLNSQKKMDKTFVRFEEIRDTEKHYTEIDTSKFKKIYIELYSTLDTTPTIRIISSSAGKTDSNNRIWNGVDWENPTIKLNKYLQYSLNSRYEYLNNYVGDNIKFRISCEEAPTTGVVDVILWGVVN